ncbi:MAG: sensor histidine kinase [Lachnospiraceae bacterium]|nr:sensor histidine kinase [Lachnospiraceae bacterium]
MEANYRHLCISKSSQIKTAMVMLSININQLQTKFTADPELIDVLNTKYKTQNDLKLGLMKYQKINNSFKECQGISDIRLYIDEDILQGIEEFNGFYPITNEVRHTPWFKLVQNSSDGFWMSQKRVGIGDINYWELNYFSRISLPGNGKFAILQVTVSNDYLRSLIDQDQYDIYIASDDNTVFFSTDRYYAGNKIPVPGKDAETVSNSSDTGKIKGDFTIYAEQTLNMYKTKSHIKILVSNSSFYLQLRKFVYATILLALIAIIISFIIVFSYNKYFTDRIRILRMAMHKAANNDYEIVNSIHGEDELSQTFSDLKLMATTLKEKEMSIYKSKIAAEQLRNEQQQMEMKLLAGQINPHFLYNTLEMLRMKALTEGNRSLSKAIQMLGKCMHYVLGNTKATSTTLEKEITYLQNYLSIMKMRFGNRLDYDVRIDPTISLSESMILPLLIQPIVENAIIHGLEETGEPGLLILRLKKKPDNTLLITVFDNGIGMDRETLEKMRSCLNEVPDPHANHGVAMYNINTRIHLFYGEEYGLRILSQPGRGTIVNILIPLQTNMGE